MADGLYRYYGVASGQQQHFYQQRSRHTTDTGSPIRSSRNHLSLEAPPSPSHSPAGQASSHQFAMYGQGHGGMMNGTGHRGFMQLGASHKYQHPSQQHHGHQNQHHNQNQGVHGLHGALGHQYNTSTGLGASSAQNFGTALQNGGISDEQVEISDSFPPHWQHQLQLLAEARANGQQGHRHCRKFGATLTSKAAAPPPQAEDTNAEDSEAPERHRPTAVTVDPRQDWDGMDMSGQGLRCLAIRLFQDYAFLTKLYIDNNKLTMLPRAISNMRSLTHLTASNNHIRELPDTIGMLSCLEEFLIFDNAIRSLPVEFGYLYKLETFGIEGNPLDDETKEFLIQNGTAALVTQMRDNAPPPRPPRPRQLIVTDDSEANEVLSVLHWNVLCDKYATATQYRYTPSRILEWEYRRDLIIEEIKNRDADFLCLQEVDLESYEEFFRRELAFYHYQGIFWQKTRARTMAEREARLVDGCALFYKSQKYILLDKFFLDYANTAINRADMKGEHDIFNRVMPRDNIAVTAFFENRMTGSRIVVANTHCHWDPALHDVKLVQVAILMDQITKKAEKWSSFPAKTNKAAFRHTEQDRTASESTAPEVEPAPSQEYSSGTQIPLILCGDFNSTRESGVYELLARGAVGPDHADLAGRSYGAFTKEGMAHPYHLRSAYSGDPHDYIEFTNYTPTFVGHIEYIWHSTNLRRRKVLGDVDFDYLQKVPGFPNHHFPSDHLPLYAEFAVEPRKKNEAAAESGRSGAGGGGRDRKA